jgi:hypothetical protein
MKARTHKLIGTIVTATAAAGILAGGALAQAPPDWVERAAGARTATVSTKSTFVPLPDWVERAGNRNGASGRIAVASTVRSAPDWVERAVLRASHGPANVATASTVISVPDLVERAILRAIAR